MSAYREHSGGKRCWGTSSLEMAAYHDNVWGSPETSLEAIFESQTLQLMQCGLTWKCVFNKRAAFRHAFAGFDPFKVARFDAKQVEGLRENKGIIRNKTKINAVIENARRIIAMEEETGSGSFVRFLWQYSPESDDERLRVRSSPSGTHMRSTFDNKQYEKRTQSDAVHPTKTVCELSKALKAKGFKFMGPTVVLSFMQAIGLMNHHDHDCCVFEIDEEKYRQVKASLGSN